MRQPALVILGFWLALISLPASPAPQPLHLVTDEWPPYEFTDPDTQRPSGLAIDILAAVFGRMGLPAPQISVLPWARAEIEARAGKVDGVFVIAPTPERLRDLRFLSEPLVSDQGTLFISSERTAPIRVEALADLKEISVGVVRGYAYSPELWQLLRESGNYTVFTTEHQLLRMVSLGRIDAAVSYRLAGQHIVSKLGLQDSVEPLDLVLFSHQFFLAFSRSRIADDFVLEFDAELRAFRRSEAYRKLVRRYTSTD